EVPPIQRPADPTRNFDARSDCTHETITPHYDSGSFCSACCTARGMTLRPPVLGGRLVPAPLRQDPADGLGPRGRNPVLYVTRSRSWRR
ncbi:MAG TPA: hypothetical protein P5552_16655, partial [Candidatus Competibacteraceae bacterium]|nr:hypothetical protein [Candidatus Competibacteraceae bacterium]